MTCTAAVASCAVLIGLASCAGPSERPAERPDSPAPAGTVTQNDSIRIELTVPETARRGLPVPVVITVHNQSGKPADLYLHGREPTLDIVVRAADGRVTWRRLANENLGAILRIQTLGAAGSLTIRGEWTPGDAGEYSVTGVVLSESPRLESSPRRVVVR